MKTNAFRDMTAEELSNYRQKSLGEIFHLRIQQQSGQLEKPSRLREIRRLVARIETLIATKSRLLRKNAV